MKRILSLDGGGIHGVFTLQVLRKIESEIAARRPDCPNFVLADHFDLIAGTSTGAIIASMLAWGMRVDDIERFYLAEADNIFYPTVWWRRPFYNRFTSERLARTLQKFFLEADGSPALLGSSCLRTLLLVVLRDASTGSPWPLTNNPRSRYNDRNAGRVSNLEIPLWSIVRASTAAPTYFPPQQITIGSKEKGQHTHHFIDGGVSPYNNPAYLAYLIATLPEYRIGFPRGTDQLQVVSVGVGQRRSRYLAEKVQDMNVVGHVRAVIRAMLDAASVQQDLLCRTTGLCLHGSEIDRELGNLVQPPAEFGKIDSGRQFSYVRYNHTYSQEEVAVALKAAGGAWDLSNVKLMPFAKSTGQSYAASNVLAQHLR